MPEREFKFSFLPNDDNPKLVDIFNPLGEKVAELSKEYGGQYLAMYHRLLNNQGHVRANDFMNGFVAGLTHRAIYADEYPKLEIIEEGKYKYIIIRSKDFLVKEKIRITDIITPDSHDIGRYLG